MRRLQKILMRLVICCSICLLVYSKTNDSSVVHANDYGISNPTYTDEDTVWDTVYFGYYYQSQYNNKKEPIRWKVLSVDGNDAFIMAEQCLDCLPYNSIYEDVTWETCSLRKWLNEDFYNTAFTTLEKAAIISTNVVNDDTVSYCPNGIYQGTGVGGNNTSDRIYLLSVDEANNKQYGFGGYITRTRGVEKTYYAGEQGISTKYKTEANVWLRSPGSDNKLASFISTSGQIYTNEVTMKYSNDSMEGYIEYTLNNHVDTSSMGVQPVLHIDLSYTKVWRNGGKISSKAWGEDVKGTKVVVPKNYFIKINDLYYRVTKTGKKNGEVEVARWDNIISHYAVQRVEIPKSVNIKGYTYKVTGIGDKAFDQCKNMKTLIIGSNVKKIGENAFLNCKKLKMIEIKSSKLKSVGKNALKGINKKATIKVPKKQYKKYKKLFKSKTGYKKTMKIRK